MQCFRRLKDKINSEHDDSISPSSNVSHKDLLVEMCKQTTPRVLLHRISSSTISRYKSTESLNSDTCLRITSPYDALIKSPSVHLERLLIQTPPPEPNICTSTPISRKLNSYSNESPTREARVKRPSRKREMSPDIQRRKSKKQLS